MQSWWDSHIETLTKTATSGVFAYLSNYFLLERFWTLPPDWIESLEMVAWFGGGSFLIGIVIRRWFNAKR